MRELLQHFSHFIAAFAASNVNDDLSICPFGDAVLGNSLSGAEGARYTSRTTLRNREVSIQNPLAGD